MGSATGQGNTTNVVNYLGELFFVTPSETRFLSMIGGLGGAKRSPTNAPLWTWQTQDNPSPSQDTKLEGADATFSIRTCSEVKNVLQIHQEAFELSYTVQAAWGDLAGEALVGNQPVRDERANQAQAKLAKIARDVNYSFLQGTFNNPGDPTSDARQTRGLNAAVTTNTVAAGTSDLSKAHVDEVMRTMADNGAPFRNVVVFANAWNKQRFSTVYGIAPDDRRLGGVNIDRVLTDFAEIGIVYERDQSTSAVTFAELSEVASVFLPIPNKGHFFMEPLDKTGSADKWQFYGEIGLEYGPELWHGEITGTTTS